LTRRGEERDHHASLLENRPHGTGRDLIAEPGQFAMDASITPGGVLGGQPQHQPTQLGCRAPAAASRASGLSPASLHQVPVPPQDRGRGDDAMQSTCWGQQPGQRREHRAVRPGQSRSVHLTAQHGDLVTQHEDLRILRMCTAGQQSQPGHDLPEDHHPSADGAVEMTACWATSGSGSRGRGARCSPLRRMVWLPSDRLPRQCSVSMV